MSVPKEYQGRFAFHFCHVDNLPGVLQHGLLSCNEQVRLGIRHLSVAQQSIQQRRAQMPVTCGPRGVVHDYVPLYLCKRSSMLMAVLQTKNVDQQMLVYLAVPIDIVARADTVFSAAAANTEPPPTFHSAPKDLQKLNWSAIDSQKWAMANDAEKQARMAEILVHRRLAISDVAHIVVWNESVRDIVLQIFKDAGLPPPPIKFDSHHYFTQYPIDTSKSLVTGPYFTRRRFEAAIADLTKGLGKSAFPQFDKLTKLRAALQVDPKSVAPVAELFGLKSDNIMHKKDIGQHTEEVVSLLRQSKAFAELSSTDQLLCEIGAYFHDVGKGPRERWKTNSYRQKVDPDHPLTGAEMVASYLKNSVASMKQRSIRVLLMLVCYHDLIGDIIGKGRNRDQLLDAITDTRDLDMLIALAEADTKAVHPAWWQPGEVDKLRTWAIEELQKRASSAQDGDEDD